MCSTTTYVPVSPSVPEMEGIYCKQGTSFLRMYLWWSLCTLHRWQLPSAIQVFVVCLLWCMQRMSSAFNSDCLLILHTRCWPHSVSDLIIRAIGYSVMWMLRQRWWSNGTALVTFCFRLHYPNDGYSAMWMLRRWSWANVTALASLSRGSVCARTPTESGRQEVRVNN